MVVLVDARKCTMIGYEWKPFFKKKHLGVCDLKGNVQMETETL